MTVEKDQAEFFAADKPKTTAATTEKAKPVRTVVIDTADRAYGLCLDHVCKQLGITHPSEADWGKGWASVRKEWERVIQKLNMLDVGLIILCHENSVKLKKKHVEIDRYQPDLPKGGLEIVFDLSDIIFHYTYRDDDSRVLIATPSEDRMAGCRGGLIKQPVEPSFIAIEKAIHDATGRNYRDVLPVITIYGAPKIGKSTLASEFPGAVFADFENGLKFLDVKKQLCKSWAEPVEESFLAFCAKL